ncbi:hypothetical protein LLEC1_03846 [Akanthomyces lecanii]|uniref:Calcium channel YVC1-like C-terminal transmembrane domain-containing protein n=1 Tax=Cordyceps confragosa TaxID=2714763 RepID=A0A179I670_CORDF|nr:hypothetical protein LLEC1_03846 [Akanthomyces lecanii]
MDSADGHLDQSDEPEPEADAEAEACLRDYSAQASDRCTSVYVNIHRVRRLVLASIDDPYTMEHFRQPNLNALIVRPLVDRLYDSRDNSIGTEAAQSRADLQNTHPLIYDPVRACREQDPSPLPQVNPDDTGLLLLAHVLVEGYDPFQGAPRDVEAEWRHVQWPIQERPGHERQFTALELAIISESKSLIGTAACQRLVDAIHKGQVTYTPLSFVDVLPDHYKHLPISIYNPRHTRLLNHYRLIVPRVRTIIEFIQIILLLILYILTMLDRHTRNSWWEVMFSIYTAGWVLQEFAAILEHGWEVHAQSLWSFLDISFVAIYVAYFLTRIYDICIDRIADGYGLHILCLAAPILLTRVAFNIMPNNIVFISLHAMMKDFTVLTFLAFWCFTGFLLALMWLITAEQIETGDTPNWATVCKWLLWIWFGLDGTGIGESTQFHIVFGPALMIGFAFLGNTLFLTILVAILTNTFSRIIANEGAEIRFRRTVLTFESVKSDSIFAYPPPFNIAAMILLLPLKLFVSGRTFHTVNVFLIRVLNAPVLMVITLLERRGWKSANRPRRTKKPSWLSWQFAGFFPHGDIPAVFNAEPPADLVSKIDQLDPLEEVPVLEDDVIASSRRELTQARLRRSTMTH